MPFQMKPQRLQEIQNLIDRYEPILEPLSQQQATALAHSRDTVRVHLYAWHIKDFQQHEQQVLSELGHVCHLEHKKIRTLLARKHREWLDQAYPWLLENEKRPRLERRHSGSTGQQSVDAK
ncbi:hypothetical protein [Deinococcus cellulosilyticus]|uniref:Uncharacterized protein n=1 Tax=Deinococcus cellulosilyticus (strain DSM 18568 / NBRC 106333 / KACC 11606 / 5516J-15) TaxID=1223518 RepID=A0A511N7G2_DEIC1|nr:hypothetical protein [Deinococcus cellulosilyticus]GEM48351.1 hypothetical protein DC3_39860 [Deinococcus cellulosilyticus NBRC 106333 = KACC 11606]